MTDTELFPIYCGLEDFDEGTEFDPRPPSDQDFVECWRIAVGSAELVLRIEFVRRADVEMAICGLAKAGIKRDPDLDSVGFDKVRQIAIESLAW